MLSRITIVFVARARASDAVADVVFENLSSALKIHLQAALPSSPYRQRRRLVSRYIHISRGMLLVKIPSPLLFSLRATVMGLSELPLFFSRA